MRVFPLLRDALRGSLLLSTPSSYLFLPSYHRFPSVRAITHKHRLVAFNKNVNMAAQNEPMTALHRRGSPDARCCYQLPTNPLRGSTNRGGCGGVATPERGGRTSHVFPSSFGTEGTPRFAISAVPRRRCCGGLSRPRTCLRAPFQFTLFTFFLFFFFFLTPFSFASFILFPFFFLPM